ncbi:polyadenylate-binding protein 4 isoform X1 [Arabidopsis lyrata subsp. lyrata]|nr:polyadenylate-binding protein 4 isoform X1 [Arabidopsis lyrata subsp. lyrata]|eukprot:XP_002870649.2 polyadenylate-binding protein 4 isoform X1 [Arabidopsis lyrata subsp. lyrata]
MASSSNLLAKRKPEDDLETKPILKKHKEISEKEKEITEGFADSLHQVELLETKSDQPNLISVKEAAVRKKTLFIETLPYDTEIPNIIDFFKKVGEVVRVRLILNLKGTLVGCGFVEFASSNEAEEALQKKNGEYLCGHKIVLDVANKGAKYLPPKYCIDHKVCYEDYLRRESLPIEEDETPPGFVEKVLFVANLSPQTKISDIKDFCKDVGEVVSVRLIVNHECKHVGYGFVEFASANAAKKALEKKNGEYLHDHKILLMKGLDETPDFVEAVAVRKKTLFVAHLSHQTEISHIISFFKDVGEVVHVRLIVDYAGKHLGDGFVEFASANEAEKALEKKNGEYLHDRKILLDVAKTAPYPPRPKYCIDHKVWYEDYIRRESLLIEEDEAVEGHDETPDFVEEVAVRKKTLFFANLFYRIRISNIINFFKDVGEVVGVRLIVNHRGEHVCCGFVEFSSANEAKKALQMKNGENFLGRFIFLDVVKLAPYPIRPKYNLVEKLWFEEYLRRQYLLIEDNLETKPNKKKQKAPTMMSRFCGKKITFSYDD